MVRSTLLFSIILCLAAKSNHAQTGAVIIDTLLVGTWHGTSLCQINNSRCHDETVVYRISKNSGTDTFYVNGSKIVNGVEEEMGILPLFYNRKTNQLTSSAYGDWTFNIEIGKLEGTLFVRGDLYRKILIYKRY